MRIKGSERTEVEKGFRCINKIERNTGFLPDSLESVSSDGLQRSTCGGACSCSFPELAFFLFNRANETAKTDARTVFPDPCERKQMNIKDC